MDIEITKTGKMLYQFPNDVAIALIECGLATQIVPKAKPPAPTFPEWGVCIYPKTGEYYIRHVIGATTEEFKGDVAAAKNAFKSVHWNPESQKRELMGPDTPDWVIEELAALRGQPLAAQVQRAPKF